MNYFKSTMKSALAAGAALLIAVPAMAAVIGLLYVGPDADLGVAVQKIGGETELLIQIGGNTGGTKYGFSPGNAFNPASVIDLDGKTMAVLSLMENTKGMPSHPLIDVDPATHTTVQRTSLTGAIAVLAKMNYLVDRDGKKDYRAEDIQGVVFVYQYKPAGAMDTTLGAKSFLFDELAEGGVLQLLGDEVTPVP